MEIVANKKALGSQTLASLNVRRLGIKNDHSKSRFLYLFYQGMR